MTVIVKCFAIARDLTGFAERAFQVDDDATAGEVLDAVVRGAPRLAPHASKLAIAVNLEYVARSYVLSAGDEVALIPPVCGGMECGGPRLQGSAGPRYQPAPSRRPAPRMP